MKRACPNKVMAQRLFVHDAHLGRALLFLDILAEYTLLSMTVMVTPRLWCVVGMKLVMSYVKFPQAPFARAPFGECRKNRCDVGALSFFSCKVLAPVLDIQSPYRSSYSQSPYVLQASQGIALCPRKSGQNHPKRGSDREPRGRSSSCPPEAIALYGANHSYSIAKRGFYEPLSARFLLLGLKCP